MTDWQFYLTNLIRPSYDRLTWVDDESPDEFVCDDFGNLTITDSGLVWFFTGEMA